MLGWREKFKWVGGIRPSAKLNGFVWRDWNLRLKERRSLGAVAILGSWIHSNWNRAGCEI